MTAVLAESDRYAIEHVDLVSLLGHFNVPVRKEGARYKANCWQPEHEDGNPSVIINTMGSRGKPTFYCMACKATGDGVDIAEQLGRLSKEEAREFLRRFVGNEQIQGPGFTAVRNVPVTPELPSAVQAQAVREFLGLVDTVVKRQGTEQALTYLEERGISREVAAAAGPLFTVNRTVIRQLTEALARSPAAERFLQAGLLKRDPDTGRIKGVWWDDVMMGVSCRRDGTPMFCWARRLYPERSTIEHLKKTRYVNQIVQNGARWVPYNLGAIRRAIAEGRPLRIVEGPITALGSESLRDGNAAPTIGMLSRVGFDKHITTRLEHFFDAVMDDLRKVPVVQFVYDQDAKPATLAEGKHLAGNLASWARERGVRAEFCTLDAWGYPDKDFADVAKRQRLETVGTLPADAPATDLDPAFTADLDRIIARIDAVLAGGPSIVVGQG